MKLLTAIEEHSMSYLENRYEVSTIIDSLKNFLNLKQRDDESLVDYTRRFKSARDIMISNMGKFELPKLASSDPKWDKDDEEIKQQCNNNEFEKFIAYLLLENSLLTNIAPQYSMGQN